MEEYEISWIISTTARNTTRTLHTFGAVKYRGKRLDVLVLRNGNDVRPLRSFCIQNNVIRHWRRHGGGVQGLETGNGDVIKTNGEITHLMYNRNTALGDIG
jgi:hypothetical protein